MSSRRLMSLWPSKGSQGTPRPLADYPPEEAPLSAADYEAAAAQAKSAALEATAGRSPSLIERMDATWTSWFEGCGIPRFGFIDGGVAWLEALQSITGLPWSAMLLAFGFLIRLMTVPLSIYGERATLRLALATDEVRKEFDDFQHLLKSGSASKAELLKAAEVMNAARGVAFARHGTSNKATMAPLLGSPLFMWAFSVVLRLLNEAPTSVARDSGVAWLAGVPLADPFGVIPMMALACTVSNFEITYARRRNSSPNKHTGWLLRIPWIVRGAALVSIPFIITMRSGTALFWLGMSAASLLQPLLLSSKAFCSRCRIPSLQQVAAAAMSSQPPVK